MLFINHDPLRDPIWQFIGVIISAVLSVSGLVLPYLLPGGQDKREKLSKAYWTLIHQDNSLGCTGSLGLFFLLIVAWYLLYHLLLRMFLLDRSLDQNTLLVTTIVIIFCITIFFTIFKHSQLLLLLVFHFCTISIVFSLMVISLKLGTFVYKDFTFVKQFIAQYIPSINNIPLQLKTIPIDEIITDRAAAQTIFIWVYGISLFFFLFLYGISKRREGLRASAFAYQSAERREIILQELEKQDREVTIQLKQLDVEKKRVAYAHSLSATLADTVQPGADAATRATLIRQYIPDFLQLGSKKTSDIILPHLQNIGASPAPLAKTSKKSRPISNFISRAVRSSSVVIKHKGQSARVSSRPSSRPSPLATSRQSPGQSPTLVVKPTPSLEKEFELPSSDLVVPDLLNLNYFGAVERALNAGMKVVVKREEVRSDVEPGTVVYQYPGPESRIDHPIKDMNNHSPEITVILSKQKSLETQALPAIVEESDNKTPPGDETPQPGSQKSEKGKPGKKQKKQHGKDKNAKKAPLDGETPQPGSQKSPKEKPGKKQKKHRSKDKSGNKAPLDGETLRPGSQKPEKEKSGKKQKKRRSKAKNGKVLLHDEVLQPGSQKSPKEKLSKKQKKRKINSKVPLDSATPQTGSQETQKEKPVELRVDDTADSSVRPLITHQDEEGQNPPIEDVQISQRLREAKQATLSSESKQLVNAQESTGEFSNSQVSTSLEPIPANPLKDIEESSAPSSLSKEQIIYLDPEDELTKVRERIEEAHARHIILVVLPQMQLRSHVGWRLLHSHARELGKDVLVISADRQIRAVAKAAGFRIAGPLESPVSNKTHPGSLPTRRGTGRKTIQQPRTQGGRGVLDTRALRQREHKSPPHKEGEPDPFIEDYRRSQQIREAAQSARTGEGTQPADERAGREPISALPVPRNTVPPPPPDQLNLDPFAEMEDRSSVSLPEQRGSTFVQELDDDIPDISDIPADVYEIEDLDDQGDFVETQQSPTRQWSDALLTEPEEEAPRIYGLRPRSGRSGTLPRKPAHDFDDEDLLAPPHRSGD